MCGILGVLLWEQPVDPSRFLQALSRLAHRGPDGQGHWFRSDGKLALGHRRLSLVDIPTGQQPLLTPDQDLVAVVNGEFYDEARLRQRLIRQGHLFQTHSDSELILPLYRTYGLDCVQHLRGEFALLLWDRAQSQLVALRDRFGIKPLYYAITTQGVFFASEIKALLALGLPAYWDKQALAHSLCFQYLPPDRTLFDQIHQLPPGCGIRVRNQTVERFRYWDLDYPSAENLNPDFERPDIAVELRNAITLRLRGDTPACVHLSGGLDSSSVAGIMAESTRPLHAFTVVFPEAPAHNEADLAQETAAFLGADWHPVPVVIEDMISHTADAVYMSEGLLINGHGVGKYLLNQAIRQAGFKVALTGEGADEIFLGYPHFQSDLALHTDINQGVDPHPLAGIMLPSGQALSLNLIQKQLGHLPGFMRAKATLGSRLQQLMTPEWSASQDLEALQQFWLNHIDRDQLHGRAPIHQAAYLWSKFALSNYILNTLGDGMEMAHGIEGRLPFLDHHVVEKLRAIAPEAHFHHGQEKYLLRQALRPQLTQAVYQRTKHPFIAPPLLRSARWRDFIKSSFLELPPLPFIHRKSLLQKLTQVHDAPSQQLWDPAMMMVLSALFLQERFGLGWR